MPSRSAAFRDGRSFTVRRAARSCAWPESSVVIFSTLASAGATIPAAPFQRFSALIDCHRSLERDLAFLQAPDDRFEFLDGMLEGSLLTSASAFRPSGFFRTDCLADLSGFGIVAAHCHAPSVRRHAQPPILQSFEIIAALDTEQFGRLPSRQRSPSVCGSPIGIARGQIEIGQRIATVRVKARGDYQEFRARISRAEEGSGSRTRNEIWPRRRRTPTAH